ncbi:flavodoxin family protein [Desulfobacterales bacterium HSG17]|nr:flavodoxin family protein [Desulfobacterales bacterium HSG17]
MTQILGISSSPVKNGNTENLLDHMMKAARDNGCDTKSVKLSGMEIKECIHCNACISKQKEHKYCMLQDDAQTVFEMAEDADILLFVSPVYHMRTNARMAALLDRMRVFIFGNISSGKLKNKVGISAAVAWKRHGGFETTHLSHMYAFFNFDMIPVGCHHSISPLGASVVSSKNGHGIFEKDIKLGIFEDEAGLKSGEMIIERAVEVSNKLKN